MLKILYLASIGLLVNCFIAPTNQRTACVYNLKEKTGPFGASDDSCAAIGLTLLDYDNPTKTVEDREVASAGANWMLANCLAYYEKLKECKKEENNYIPTLHPQ